MEQGIYFIKQGIKFGEAHNEIWSSEKTSAAHTRHLRSFGRIAVSIKTRACYTTLTPLPLIGLCFITMHKYTNLALRIT